MGQEPRRNSYFFLLLKSYKVMSFFLVHVRILEQSGRRRTRDSTGLEGASYLLWVFSQVNHLKKQSWRNPNEPSLLIATTQCHLPRGKGSLQDEGNFLSFFCFFCGFLFVSGLFLVCVFGYLFFPQIKTLKRKFCSICKDLVLSCWENINISVSGRRVFNATWNWH